MRDHLVNEVAQFLLQAAVKDLGIARNEVLTGTRPVHMIDMHTVRKLLIICTSDPLLGTTIRHWRNLVANKKFATLKIVAIEMIDLVFLTTLNHC